MNKKHTNTTTTRILHAQVPPGTFSAVLSLPAQDQQLLWLQVLPEGPLGRLPYPDAPQWRPGPVRVPTAFRAFLTASELLACWLVTCPLLSTISSI